MDSEIEDLTIDDEFKNLIPKISLDEYKQLELNILEEGVRDKIVVWETDGKKIILDGHNRYNICRENKLKGKIKLKIKHFETREEAINYMIKNQLGRRNLTSDQKRYFIGKLYNENKKQSHRPQKTLT
jgi:ParB-like chromosome segregation protein Spo0J